MTAYITITDAETDPEAPLTSELAKKWRDNPVSIAEQDASVPAGVRLGFWPLGNLATTSGSSVTLSGLNLSEFKYLWIDIVGVSVTGASISFRINSVIVGTFANNNTPSYGNVIISLVTGRVLIPNNLSQTATNIGYTTATTSVTFSLSSTAFAGGSIRVYGVK